MVIIEATRFDNSKNTTGNARSVEQLGWVPDTTTAAKAVAMLNRDAITHKGWDGNRYPIYSYKTLPQIVDIEDGEGEPGKSIHEFIKPTTNNEQ